MTINQTINQKHTCNTKSAFMRWWESSGANGNLKGKMRRNVLPVGDPCRRKGNGWRWSVLFVGGSMAGGRKSACSALLSLLAAALGAHVSALLTAVPRSALALVVVWPSLVDSRCCIEHPCLLLPDLVTTSAQLDPGDVLCW